MMHRRYEKGEARRESRVNPDKLHPDKLGIRSVAMMSALLALAGLMQPRSQSQVSSEGPNTFSIRMPDADEPMGAVGRHALREANRRLILDRQKQMADDSAKLLRLATDLKAEVDSSSQHTLSTGAVRKADEIAKLAHNVKEKMKLTFP
jgi:hypothetical protein